VALVWGLTSLGGLLDRRPWAAALEAARLALLALLVPLASLAPAAAACLAGAAVASGAWLAWALRKGLPLAAELR
jgi:hypothetical protein